MKIAIYEKSTGLIKRFVECSYSNVSNQCKETEEFFLNCSVKATHIINGMPETRQIVESESDLLFKIREQRARILQDCDWTQTLDSPIPEKEKARYRRFRQALRDFPKNCDVYNPIWPKLEDF